MTHACYYDSASGFVGEVEAFADLASAHCKKHGAIACRVCGGMASVTLDLRGCGVTFKLRLEIETHGRQP